jgi:hypothetical protein
MAPPAGARPSINIALLHHPVLDKNGQVVTTAVTNMDIHDISRSARTYGVERFFIVTPVLALRVLVERIIEHWSVGFGSTYNVNRTDALSVVRMANDLDGAIVDIERDTGRCPRLVITSARQMPGCVTFGELRVELESAEGPYLLVLGTGWGLTPQVVERGDVCLEPIAGGGYNHLSVRAAAAISLDRLLGAR